MTKHKILIILACTLLALILFVVINLVIIKYNGKPVPVPEIPRGPQQLGNGPELTYVIMGDSTAVTQGADYGEGYAFASAQHLAQKYRVTFVNTAVSGAVSRDIADKQLAEAASYKPDIVLIAVGANDVTHFTHQKVIEDSIQRTVDELKDVNPDVQIILTGSAAMDTVDRFTWTAKQLALQRVKAVNKTFSRLIARNHLVFAPIADKTRAAFNSDPTLFAQDKFHPNARGYALWIPVIDDAVDEATRRLPK